MDIRVAGLERMARKLNAISRNDVLIGAISRGANHIQRWIVENRLGGPRPRYLGVVTGVLQSSIQVVRGIRVNNEIVVKIGPNVLGGKPIKYAATHEFGRGNIPARPFLRPGIEDPQNKRFVINHLINSIKLAVEAQK